VRFAAALVCLTACSLALVDGPPKPVPPQGPIDCDTSPGGALVADVVFGILFGLFGLAAGSFGEHCPEGESCDNTGPTLKGALIGGAFALPWFFSAYVGGDRASDCRALKASTHR